VSASFALLLSLWRNSFSRAPRTAVPILRVHIILHISSFSAQPSSSTPPFVQQNTRPSGQYQPSPNLNLGRFEANSQASAPNQNFSFPTAPFNPDIFKHFANASIPPPPPPNFPPVVIPNLAFPQFTQDLTASNATPFQPTGGVPAGSESHDAYDPRFPQQLAYNPRASSSFPAAHDVNAEGQRKDEGSASSRTVSHEEQAQEQSELYGKTRHPSNFDGQCFIDCDHFCTNFPSRSCLFYPRPISRPIIPYCDLKSSSDRERCSTLYT